ncbi:MAG: hypothetical protein HRU20_15520 [Pseudomonadales bacterium]|nr:hypothetical protein [Pseudomonadales bacterium]
MSTFLALNSLEKRFYLSLLSSVSVLFLAAALSYFSYALLKTSEQIPAIKQSIVTQINSLNKISKELKALEKTLAPLLDESQLLRQSIAQARLQHKEISDKAALKPDLKPSIKPSMHADEHQATWRLLAKPYFTAEDNRQAEKVLLNVLQGDGDLALPWSNTKHRGSGMVVTVSEKKYPQRQCKTLRLLAMKQAVIRQNKRYEFCQDLTSPIKDQILTWVLQ